MSNNTGVASCWKTSAVVKSNGDEALVYRPSDRALIVFSDKFVHVRNYQKNKVLQDWLRLESLDFLLRFYMLSKPVGQNWTSLACCMHKHASASQIFSHKMSIGRAFLSSHAAVAS